MSVFIETLKQGTVQNAEENDDDEWKRATRLRLDKGAANRFIQHAVRRAQASNRKALKKKVEKDKVAQPPATVRRSLRIFIKENPEMKSRVLTAVPSLWTKHKSETRYDRNRQKSRARRQQSIQEQRSGALTPSTTTSGEPQLFSFNLVLPPFLSFGLSPNCTNNNNL